MASPPPSGPGYSYWQVDVVDPANMLSNGSAAEMLVGASWGNSCTDPDCWRATFQDGSSLCGEGATSDGMYSASLGCAYKDGTSNDYPYDVNAPFESHGNFVAPGLVKFRLFLSGVGDGYAGASGGGVDLYGNANRTTDCFYMAANENAHFSMRVVIGTAATGYGSAAVQMLSCTHCVPCPSPPVAPPVPPAAPAPPSPPPPNAPPGLPLQPYTSGGALSDAARLGLIIGGSVAGGLAAVCCCVFLVGARRRRRKEDRPSNKAAHAKIAI